MKKISILFVAVLMSSLSFAQRAGHVTARAVRHAGAVPAAKTTAPGDTLTLKHITTADTVTIYKVDSNGGYTTGINRWNDKAFAERYDYTDDTGKDMQVIGCFALFDGRVNPSSEKTVTFKIWSEGPKQSISATRYYRGFPFEVMDSLTVPVTQLGISPAADTLKKYIFPHPGAHYTSFFAGYSINYNYFDLAGDTLGLACSRNGERHPAPSFTLVYNISEFGDTVLDTIINVQNTTMEANNTWYDNYSQVDSILNNLAIYPIVIMGHTAAVDPVRRNELTFFGNYPNPATGNTTVRFSLASPLSVTLQLTDVAGHVVGTMDAGMLSAGTHELVLDLSALPVGEYFYLIRTSAGDGIASKLIRE